jgi:thiamine pyrophosphate-dependent acetolactate synthase large subunit-like protein
LTSAGRGSSQERTFKTLLESITEGSKSPSAALSVDPEVTIIGSNRSYEILELELLRAGVAQTGPMARSMLRLDNPLLNWAKIGEGFGVPSIAVDSAAALARELERSLTHKGPHLIEAIMASGRASRLG